MQCISIEYSNFVAWPLFTHNIFHPNTHNHLPHTYTHIFHLPQGSGSDSEVKSNEIREQELRERALQSMKKARGRHS